MISYSAVKYNREMKITRLMTIERYCELKDLSFNAFAQSMLYYDSRGNMIRMDRRKLDDRKKNGWLVRDAFAFEQKRYGGDIVFKASGNSFAYEFRPFVRPENNLK